MMEFTVSRVVLCACGVILLAASFGFITGIQDIEDDEADDRLVQRIGYMLDSFEASDVDEIILDGSMILPKGGYLKVYGGFAELYVDGSRHVATTSCVSEFDLEYGEVKRIIHRMSQLSS